MVYFFSDLDKISDTYLINYEKYVSEIRRKYSKKYKFQIDRKLSIIVFILLRVGLFREFGIRNKIEVYKHENGKPYLDGFPNLFISFSHCKNAVACGISTSNIGVDVQEYVNFDESVAERFFCSDEIKQISMDSNGFTKLWTLKESFCKYKGTGLSAKIRDVNIFDFNFSMNTLFYKSFVLSVISNTKEKVVYIDMEEINSIISDLDAYEYT
ncbi:4'-phosphopantetheinyl transferase family protein [Treponema bryantii]|uniref:4'-phosphopantetheinyl transferase family protein n=1 Tax=Treponema bryantii TaxID=163 RepID=UPI002B2C51E0|nr:4'-phosphopantetheinyl transferase [Treponema bryantii]